MLDARRINLEARRTGRMPVADAIVNERSCQDTTKSRAIGVSAAVTKWHGTPWSCCILSVVLVGTMTTSLQAQEETKQIPAYTAASRRTYLQPTPERDTLTSDWLGFGRQLDDVGITATLNMWYTYQANVTGGLETDSSLTGLYYWDAYFDLDRIFGMKGATIFTRVEGGWGDGINDAVGAIMNVNGAQDDDHAIGLTHLWLEQKFFDERLRIRVGKLDPSYEAFEFHNVSVAFDAMPYANTGRTQFLDEGLINNPAIGFAESAPGLEILVEPLHRLYVAGVATTSNTSQFAFDLDTVFNGDAKWLAMVETGIVPTLGKDELPGLYYVGYWYSQFENSPFGQGVYIGASQMAYREPDTKEQGLGLFARYGYGDNTPDGIRHFWSIGGQYEGLVPGRDEDIIGLGWSQGFTDGEDFSAPFEGALELYARIKVNPWFYLSPHMQYIANPGSNDVAGALTLGLRIQITF
jgi:porin